MGSFYRDVVQLQVVLCPLLILSYIFDCYMVLIHATIVWGTLLVKIDQNIQYGASVSKVYFTDP
jgi:hypothetical protein